jgi:hypothetical protein
MRSPRRLGATILLLLAVAACGKLFGSDEAPMVEEPCPREDAPTRQLAGTAIRQPAGVGLFELLPAGGRNRRSGDLGRLVVGEYTFRARAGADGGYSGRRGARAEPIVELAEEGSVADAYRLTYRDGRQDFTGMAVVGRPTPGSRLATAGQAHYRGPVRLVVQDRRPQAAGDRVEIAGIASVLVRFGSAAVDVALENLAATAEEGVAAPAAVPFARIDWSGLGVCGVRVGSTGQGGFQARDDAGRIVNFAGEGSGSPSGSAVLAAMLYGFDEAKAQPTEIGGALLIQGDAGVIAGLFAAQRID